MKIDPFARTETPPPARLWPFIGWSLNGSWGILGLSTLASALSGAFEVVSALLLGAVIDAAVAGGPDRFWTENIWLIALFVVFYVVLRPLIFGATSYTNAVWIMPNVMPQVLSRLHRWTLGQAVTFFDNDFAGRIAQKQMQTARAITDVASESVNVLAFALASIIGSMLFLVGIDGWVAVSLFVWLVAYLALIHVFMPRIRLTSTARAGARAAVTGQVVDTVTNIKTVKLFAHAAHEDRAALRAMSRYREKALDFGYVSSLFRLALMTLSGLLPVMMVGGAALLWSQGAATPGDIAAAGAISIRIAQMSGWVSMTLMTLYANLGEIEDGIGTLATPYALTDSPDAADLGPVRGAICFEEVSFAYGRRSGGVERISLDIAPGEKVGVVGASGAGKSTLVALLLRLYDTESGRVLIDGVDVRTVTQESLRRQIAMVTQETAMFNRSARDNIMYGRPEASQDEVEAAARQAEADSFIPGLHDHLGREGYEAHLGERGVKLSGGQRQRIALARAFLKDAPILVLDEATSALDSEVEAAIQDSLERIMAGKTVLAIAHRLSTLSHMDRIVVLDDGRIVEQGSHAELLAAGGLYARYWARQSGGFIGLDQAAE